MGGRGRRENKGEDRQTKREEGVRKGRNRRRGRLPVPPSFISTSKRPMTTCDRVNKGRRTHRDNTNNFLKTK